MTTEERLSMLESKVARAERSKRRQLVAGLGGLLALFALLGAGSSKNDNGKSSDEIWEEAAMLRAGKKVVYANRFVLIGENGKTRALLVADEHGAGLRVSDGNGTHRVGLGVSKHGIGSGLGLYDEDGKLRAHLGAAKDGKTELILWDGKENRRFSVDTDNENTRLTLSDENDWTRAELTVTKGGPSLDLFDEKGQGRAVLGAGATETPDGKVITYPESSLRLFRPDGREITSLP